MQFGDVIGNRELKKTLAQMVDSNRLSHAILLCEHNGGGAFPLALALAQYANCRDRKDGDSCGVCPSCHKYRKLIHPDLHFVFPVSSTKELSESEKKAPISDYFLSSFTDLALRNPYFGEQELYESLGIDNKSGNISVNEARRIFEKLSLRASEGFYKVMVIFLPEKMNQEAGNKLLKIIEEPPQQTLFLLISHNPERVLQTIRSRCLRIDLKPMDREEKNTVAPASDNASMRGTITTLLEAVSRKDLAATFPIWESLAETGREKQKEFCLYSEEFIRKIFLVANGLESLADIHPAEEEAIRGLAKGLKPHFYEKALSVLDGVISAVEGNVNPKLVFCDMCNSLLQAM